MKHLQRFVAAIIVILAIGCGGSGNSSSSSGGGSTSTNTGNSSSGKLPNSTLRVEAIVKVLTTNLANPNEWTAAQLLNPQTPGLQAGLINPSVFGVMDPTNMECGEQVVFQLVNYTVSSTGSLIRNIMPNVTFASSDVNGTYGNLSQNTGDYIAGVAPTSSALQISAFYNGNAYAAYYDITLVQVRLLGKVLAQGTQANQLAGTLVQFFDANSNLVDTVTVQFDGSFQASVPTSTTQLTVLADTVPSGFYQSFNYTTVINGSPENLQYDAGVAQCYAPLGLSGLTAGAVTLPYTIYVAPRTAGSSYPQSDGCQDEINQSKVKGAVVKKA